MTINLLWGSGEGTPALRRYPHHLGRELLLKGLPATAYTHTGRLLQRSLFKYCCSLKSTDRVSGHWCPFKTLNKPLVFSSPAISQLCQNWFGELRPQRTTANSWNAQRNCISSPVHPSNILVPLSQTLIITKMFPGLSWPALLLLLAVVPQLLALASRSRASGWPAEQCRCITVSYGRGNKTEFSPTNF